MSAVKKGISAFMPGEMDIDFQRDKSRDTGKKYLFKLDTYYGLGVKSILRSEFFATVI